VTVRRRIVISAGAALLALFTMAAGEIVSLIGGMVVIFSHCGIVDSAPDCKVPSQPIVLSFAIFAGAAAWISLGFIGGLSHLLAIPIGFAAGLAQGVADQSDQVPSWLREWPIPVVIAASTAVLRFRSTALRAGP
jgi:hypothetical protein